MDEKDMEKVWQEGYDSGFKDGLSASSPSSDDEEEVVLIPPYSNIVELSEVLQYLEPLRKSNAIAAQIISVISV